MHFTAERSPFYSQLATAEENAKTTKLNMWANYEEPKAVEVVDDTSERQCTYEQVGFFSVAMTNWPLPNLKKKIELFCVMILFKAICWVIKFLTRISIPL